MKTEINSCHLKIIGLNPWNIRKKKLPSRKYANNVEYLGLFPLIIMNIPS